MGIVEVVVATADSNNYVVGFRVHYAAGRDVQVAIGGNQGGIPGWERVCAARPGDTAKSATSEGLASTCTLEEESRESRLLGSRGV